MGYKAVNDGILRLVKLMSVPLLMSLSIHALRRAWVLYKALLRTQDCKHHHVETSHFTFKNSLDIVVGGPKSQRKFVISSGSSEKLAPLSCPTECNEYEFRIGSSKRQK